ncbi:MAG: hypothetical protein ACOC3I_09070 [Verrucomicrobiota bacterium]
MSDSSAHIPPLWQIWRNPLVWRYAHSRLRFGKTAFWYLAIFIVATFASVLAYLPAAEREMVDPAMAARWIFVPLLIIQGIVLLLMGTGSVASGIVDERLSGALDYQRMTPLSPAHKILGYLFGLPLREYVLFALTLPHALFAALRGGIPLHKVLIVYFFFWTSAVLYHLTALVAGMVVQKWRLAARLTQIAIVLLYLALPQLSQLNIFIFESLTVRPAIAHHLGPYLVEAGWRGEAALLGELGERLVPVFHYTVSETFFALVLQGLFMAMFFTMLLRKWVQDHYPPLSKGQILAVLGGFQLLLFANLWPIFTTDLTAEVQSRFPLPIPPAAVATAITIVMTVLTGLLGLWLVFIAAPSWHAYARGLRRAQRRGLARVPWSWDESPPFALQAGIAAVVSGGLVLVLWLLERTGYFALIESDWTSRLPGALAVGLALFVFGTALAYWERGRTMIAALLLGVVPLLVAIVLLSIDERTFDEPSAFLAALSPLGTVILAIAYPAVPETRENFTLLGPATWTGMALLVVYGSALGLLWRRKARSIAGPIRAGEAP